MKYQTGEIGRAVVVRFEDGEDVLGGIVEISKKENLRSAVFFLIGGLRKGRVVVGPENEELPPKPVWRELGESHETLATGTIFCEGEEPKVHLHGAFGKGNKSAVGCLREASETFLVIEAVILEIKGVTAARRKDPESGLSLLQL